MYPVIEIVGIKIFTFGIILAISWLIFIILLHQFSWREWLTKSIFASIVPLTISIFFFARLWHIGAEWVTEKFILVDLSTGQIGKFLHGFFVPQNYNFSLFGAIFGFTLFFLIKTRHKTEKKNRGKYFDAIVPAFLYAAIIGYFGALLGGQAYGIPFDSFFSILYDHKESIVPLRESLFPLPMIYIIGCLGIVLFLHKTQRKMELPPGFIGFLGMGLFSGMLFIGEFLSGKEDIFESKFFLNLNQIGACIGIIVAIIWILKHTEKHHP